ncbi:bacteriophage N4 adsorption protein B [bacterium BMS3Abin07]|nr:bacteriophage N4 adsorption protein B [bacterium BMS3Abin07]GBE32665.1 bacteriophage N4 adsorption protein B [bacterium BMS3Bbin05]HDO23316.1 hypothetical protein [Nitrospirota bacterium]HDZ88862.1 hypothetical protein [Nitrospirota bacterium]
MADRKRLGDMLVEAGLIDNIQLQAALANQKQWGMRLGAALLELKFISEKDLASFLEKQLDIECITIMSRELSSDLTDAIEPEIAKKYVIFPLEVDEREIVIATSNPLDLQMLDDLQFRLGRSIKPQLALESEIKRAIRFYYDNIRDEETVPEILQPPVVDKIKMNVEDEADMSGAAKSATTKITTKNVMEALLTVLEKKGILQRAEVFNEIKKKL